MERPRVEWRFLKPFCAFTFREGGKRFSIRGMFKKLLRK